MTNQEKIAICQKYEPYLRIINDFGNKVILRRQLWEFAKKIGIARFESIFAGQIQALIDAEIIKTEIFSVSGRQTQHRILILKKFGLRYLAGKTDPGDSQNVSPVPKLESNERILLSIFKCTFLLDKVIPKLYKRKTEISLDDIYHEINRLDMSLLYAKNKGIDYARYYQEKFGFYLNDEIQIQINAMQDSLDKRQKGLAKGSKSSGKSKRATSGVEQGKAVETKAKTHKEKKKEGAYSEKDLKMMNYNFDNMIKGNIHIVHVKEVEFNEENEETGLKVTALLFDHTNSQDLHNFGRQIACLYQMLHGMMARYPNNHSKIYDLKLVVVIAGYDQEAVDSMKRRASEKIYSKVHNKHGERLKIILENWKINPGMQDKHLTIHFTNYDITDRYMEGRKFANLLKGKPEIKTNQG